jgi:hypothetical protein
VFTSLAVPAGCLQPWQFSEAFCEILTPQSLATARALPLPLNGIRPECPFHILVKGNESKSEV